MIKKTYIITAIIILAILSAALVSNFLIFSAPTSPNKTPANFAEDIPAFESPADPFPSQKNEGHVSPEIPEEITQEDKKPLPPKSEPEKAFKKFINLPIPFASQAPTGNWKDPRQQDSCEEASVLMVIKWIKGESLSKEEAEVKLIAISEWEKREYGNFHDTSAKDTLERIIIGYFKYENAHLKNNASLENIKEELAAGNAVIAPMDGQKLNNPYYTAPGPERHMLVIRGYDADKKEFITNDPGTRRGEGYRYNEDHFFSSIRDYPTGYHEPIETVEKNIIIINPVSGALKTHDTLRDLP